jgi:hypothetical protein
MENFQKGFKSEKEKIKTPEKGKKGIMKIRGKKNS